MCAWGVPPSGGGRTVNQQADWTARQACCVWNSIPVYEHGLLS
jgi:hypothetical protein